MTKGTQLASRHRIILKFLRSRFLVQVTGLGDIVLFSLIGYGAVYACMGVSWISSSVYFFWMIGGGGGLGSRLEILIFPNFLRS